MRQPSLRTSLIVSIGILVAAIVSRFAYNGLVFGFDYGLFHPDGSLYAFKTLTLMGYSQQEAGVQVANWYADHAYKLQNIDPKSLYFDTHPAWVIYETRLAYPILSIPFVALLGLNGLLAVPTISFLILVIGIVLLGNHYKNQWVAIGIVFAITVSPTVGRWMLINSTDSLLVALVAVLIYVIAKDLKYKFWIPIVVSIVVIGSFTRFSLLLWLGFSLGLIVSKQWARASTIAITAILSFVPTLFLDFQSAVLPNEEGSSLLMKALKLPLSMVKMAYYDLAQLFVLDRVLLLVLFVAIFVAIKNLNSQSSRYFIPVLFMLWCTAGINGTPGVNFRYELPIIAVLAWVLIENTKNRTISSGADTQI
jgi:hypothetical protein